MSRHTRMIFSFETGDVHWQWWRTSELMSRYTDRCRTLSKGYAWLCEWPVIQRDKQQSSDCIQTLQKLSFRFACLITPALVVSYAFIVNAVKCDVIWAHIKCCRLCATAPLKTSIFCNWQHEAMTLKVAADIWRHHVLFTTAWECNRFLWHTAMFVKTSAQRINSIRRCPFAKRYV